MNHQPPARNAAHSAAGGSTTNHPLFLKRNRRIFEEELDDFLPDKVLDFHTHVFPAGSVSDGEMYSCAGYPIPKYDFDDLKRELADVYPGRETSAVCFGMPQIPYDRALNNRYIAENSDNTRFFGLHLFDPKNDDPNELRSQLAESPLRGLKPYWRYANDDPESVGIHDMLPSWAMEIVNDLGLIVMLHISKKGRLADADNQREIVELCERYPKARIVLAHVGRAYFLKNITGNIEPLKDIPNLWFDLAMVSNPDVLEYLFRAVDPAKIIYGTDMPIAVAPGKSRDTGDGYTYVTPVTWELSVCEEGEYTSFLYEELLGIKEAVRRLGRDDEFLAHIFYENGMRLLGPTD